MAETVPFRLDIREREDFSRLAVSLGVAGGASSALVADVDITEYDFLSPAVRSVGVEIEMDQGAGAVLTVPHSELGSSVTLGGSVDGFGVRSLAFSRRVPGQAPLHGGAGSIPRRVTFAGVRGVPGGSRAWPMFDGYTKETSVSSFPPVAFISAQDGSILNEPLFYAQPYRSLLSRAEIITDICERNRIPVPEFFFNDADNLGGYVVKAINEFGEKTVLGFLAEFLIPTGCRFSWSGGSPTVAPFELSTPVRALTFSDIRGGIEVTPPSTDTPNAVRMSSEIYQYTGPLLDGTIGPTTTDVVNAVYQPVVATHKQDKTTGVISATGLTSSSILREVSKTVTTHHYTAGRWDYTDVEIWGWYNPLACNLKQNGSGVTRVNEDFDVYRTPDLVWHYQQEETYQVVEYHHISPSYDANGMITYVGDLFRTFWDLWAPVGQRNGTNTATVYVADRYLKSDGTGWLYGRERIDIGAPLLQMHIVGWWDYDPASLDKRAFVQQVQAYASTPRYLFQSPKTTSYANAYVFGPTALPVYGLLRLSNHPYINWRTTYTGLTATTHQRTSAYTSEPAFLQSMIAGEVPTPSTLLTESVTVGTPVPKMEFDPSLQVPQPAYVLDTHTSGILGVGKTITEYAEAGWCENPDEIAAAARVRLIELRAPRVTLTTDLDFEMIEGATITLPPHPDLGHEATDLVIRSATWSVDRTQPGMGSQSIEAWLIPTELQ